MRVAVFTNQYPSKVSTFFARDMAALAAAGADVRIFPLYPLEPGLWQYLPADVPRGLTSSSAVYHLSLGGALLGSLRCLPALTHAVPPMLGAMRAGAAASAKTAYVIPKALTWASRHGGQFDHVLAYWANYAATCAFLFRKSADRRMPLSIIVHAGIDLYYNRAFLREKLLDADNIFTVCNFNREHLRELYPDDWGLLAPKIRIHQPGLDLSRFAYRRGHRPPDKLITVGRLIRLKGLDYLLRAMRILCDRGMTLTLDVVGDGEERSSLQRLAADLRLSHAVQFRGWMAPSEVREAIAASTALIHPSVRFGDAVPTVIKEAMALGTPVIASEVGGIPELVDHGRCGVLVQPENSDALASAMHTLLGNAEALLRYSARARNFAEQTFDQWKNGASMLRQLELSSGRGAVAGAV